MAKDKYAILGDAIYDKIGGIQNVTQLIHCMTRLRITVKDLNQVDMAGLKAIPGVLGVVPAETLEVVLGPGINAKVATYMVSLAGVGEGESFTNTYQHEKAAVTAKAEQVHQAHKQSLKPTWWRQALKHISSIFVPLIPAFVGAGLIAGVAGILSNLLTAGMLPKNWTLFITVLKVINTGLFGYLNIYVGMNTAKEFGGTAGLGGIIGGLVYLPGVVAPLSIPNVFTGQPLVAGQGGIIGVLFAVWLLAYVERFFHKVIPDSVDIIFTPFLTLLIIGVFTIYLVMPLAGWVSASLVGAINWVINIGGAFAGFILGLFFLPMVMFGLHQILTPIHLEMIKQLGYTPLLPILAMAGAGQVGAAIALWVRCRRNKQLTNMIKGALPVGILGVGEPLIYGVTLPLGKPFITACIGGGIGGAVIGGIGKIGAITIGPSGVALIPLIANNRWLGYVIGLLAAYAGGFVATFFFGTPKEAMAATLEDGTQVPIAEATESTESVKDKVKTAEFVAPVSGQLETLTEVKDQVFSTKMVGDGFAIIPDHGSVVAPTTGDIVSVMATKHAFTMTTPSGLEILVHLGLDTVTLKGAPFEVLIKAGDHVKAGQQVATMDLKQIRAAGKDPVVITTVTNMANVAHLSAIKPAEVKIGSSVLTAFSK